MAERDQQDDLDDPEVRESVDSFRRAGVAVSDGLRTLYEWSQAWAGRRHSTVQFAIALTVWFGGNWTYNRVTPVLFGMTVTSLRWMSSELAVTPVFGVVSDRPVLTSVQILLVLLVAVLVQNRAQTQKLNSVQSKMTTMTNKAETRTDGGAQESPPNGPRGPGGAVIGAIIGTWFGPGGILAGIYLGFWLGVKLDYRAAEQDPLTSDLNAETKTKQ